MRVAIIGTRGIPSNYSGFETFAEELGARLVLRGHRVVVYCRTNRIEYKETHYKGIELVMLPTISRKHFDTLAHTFLSVIHVLFHRVDVVIIPNCGNAVLSWVPRIFRMPVLMNVDGLEWQRKKWGRGAKSFLKISEWLATWMPNSIVTDAKVIQDYYLEKYKKTSYMIPYGAATGRIKAPLTIEVFDLKADNYFLYVSRLEPENNALMVIEAFVDSDVDSTLVIVGGAPYADGYLAKLKASANDRVKFLGFVFGDDYRNLQQNAYAYIQATEVGGTHPALIEAMGFGNCVLVNATPENLEVTGDTAIPFTGRNDLSEKIRLLAASPSMIDDYRKKAMARVASTYDWENVADSYEDILMKLAKKTKVSP